MGFGEKKAPEKRLGQPTHQKMRKMRGLYAVLINHDRFLLPFCAEWGKWIHLRDYIHAREVELTHAQ